MADIDLTKERIQTLAESRLRAARLYGEVALYRPFLHVNVGVLVSEDRRSGAYSIDVSFQKYLRDAVSGRSWDAATWEWKLRNAQRGRRLHHASRVRAPG